MSLHERKDFNYYERGILVTFATHLIGWERNFKKQAKECIVLAACTLAWYELSFKKVMGKDSLENWFKRGKILLDLQTQGKKPRRKG